MTELEKVSYCFGVNIAQNMEQQGMTEINPEILAKGLDDYLKDTDLQVPEEEIQGILQDFFAKLQEKQFGKNIAQFEKSHGSTQHDHVLLTDSGELLEFCDPRIQHIKSTIEEIFGIEIQHHSLYFYGVRKEEPKS